MATLPVFQTTGGRPGDIDVERLAHTTLGGGELKVESNQSRTTVRGPDVMIDLDHARGGLWAGDTARRWSAGAVELPMRSVGRIARAALTGANVLPRLGSAFRYARPRAMRAQTVTEQDGRRTVAAGEATYTQEIVVDVSGNRGVKADVLPFFGGGARFAATIGAGGHVVGVRGTWRDAVQADERKVLAVREAMEAAGVTPGDDMRVTGSTLGYYAAPPFVAQDLAFPVYAVTAEVRAGDRWVPSRVQLVPATDIGEIGVRESPTRPRADRVPWVAPTPVLRPGEALPSGLSVSAAVLRTRGLSPEDLLFRDVSGKIFLKPGLSGLDLGAIFEALRPRSFGTSWIGSLGGLGGSQANAQGFVDQMAAEGWQRRFNWGNAAAWKSDWTVHDDDWVDDVDFVFYTGHAGPDGWMLATNGVGDWINHSEVGSVANVPSDLWGQDNLEWVVIAACGPLEDDVINGGGNVHSRWIGAFDGLHLLLGYAAVTFDNTEEGRRVALYARQGMTMRQAWFRTAEEIQPSTNGYDDPYGPDVYAAAMWVGNATANNADDHLWGHGSVGPDIRNHTYSVAHFTPC